MTTRSRRRSFAPSSIGRRFPSGSAHSNTRAPSATTSWLGTMTPTTTAASAISRRPTCITAARRRSSTCVTRTRRVAYAAHPERFVSGPPRPETLPTAVWINPPSKTTRQDAPGPDDRHPGRLPACGRCPAQTAARSVVVAPRRWRGVATVNAEPGCLKDVDTARITPQRKPAAAILTSSRFEREIVLPVHLERLP